MSPAALVTDSTASLPADVVEQHGIVVVPLQVVIDGVAHEESPAGGLTAADVAAAMRAGRSVSTSRPSPATMLQHYEAAASAGATEIVSVHLSARLSGTHESATLAARGAPVPVEVVDSGHLGMATGFAVLSAAELLADGASAQEAAEVVRRRTAATRALFYVDTLDHLRRGGRVGAAAALLGSALAVKPLLHVREGEVAPLEKVRTAGRALARLEELAVEAAGDVPVDVAVAHLENLGRAEALREHLGQRLAQNLQGREVVLGDVGAVIGAHVGPGMVAVMVAPRPQH